MRTTDLTTWINFDGKGPKELLFANSWKYGALGLGCKVRSMLMYVGITIDCPADMLANSASWYLATL